MNKADKAESEARARDKLQHQKVKDLATKTRLAQGYRLPNGRLRIVTPAQWNAEDDPSWW